MRMGRWALLLALGLVLASCGDDGAEPAAGAGDVRAYCDAVLKIETVEEPDIDFEALTPEQQAEEAKKFARQTLLPLAEAAVAVRPDEVKADTDVLVDAVREVAETGDFGVFEKPDVEAASDREHRFELANCGWKRVDVKGVEYAFEGLPSKLEAEPTSFELTNAGKEEHEMAFFRINDDVTEPFEEILRLPEEEAMTKGTSAGHAFAEPGGDDFEVLQLEPGRYGVACFVPVGGGEEGPPHFTEGMLAEFTVA